MKASDIIRINKIIASQKWDAYTFDVTNPNDPVKSVGLVLDKLSIDEKELFLTLLSNFKTIRNYRLPCSQLLRRLIDTYPTIDHFVFSEIVDKSDESKSSGTVNYELKSLSAAYPKKKFDFKNNPETEAFQGAEGLKVFVDDFIGSGTQFLEMIDDLNKKGLNCGDGIILTIAIQQLGAEELRKKGYAIIAEHELDKSLEFLKNSEDFELDPYELNSTITEKMPISILHALGFSNSEAIISMKRTPDNTLPIFSSRGDHNKWPALFPR